MYLNVNKGIYEGIYECSIDAMAAIDTIRYNNLNKDFKYL